LRANEPVWSLLELSQIGYSWLLTLKRVTTPDNFSTSIQFAISYGGVTSNAVSSFIKQLELESTHKECPRELISEDLLRHSVGEFDLYIYQQLITDGGF